MKRCSKIGRIKMSPKVHTGSICSHKSIPIRRADVAEGYRAMDQRRAIKTLLRP